MDLTDSQARMKVRVFFCLKEPLAAVHAFRLRRYN
jgi:hypothetical protein